MDEQRGKSHPIRGTVKWQLFFYDAVLLMLVAFFIVILYPDGDIEISPEDELMQIICMLACIQTARLIFGIYNFIWRYGGTEAYLKIIVSDFMGGIICYLSGFILPFGRISFIREVSVLSLNLLLAIAVRLLYQYLYEYSSVKFSLLNYMKRATTLLTGLDVEDEAAVTQEEKVRGHRINIAIVGAGRVGAMLADELINNPNAAYIPKCFIDVDRTKVGRYIYGVRVLSEDNATIKFISKIAVQEIVFAIPDADAKKKKELYEKYRSTGCKIKIYDYPITRSVVMGKRHMREFDIEELLFRQVKDFTNEQTKGYYRGKVILITGGGGSIGSELSRQIAKMKPRQLIILDIYENCAYDIEQELKIAYGDKLDLHVEIMSICDRAQLERVFGKYRPDIVLHAAAHKHVPLMEHNCCEAVKNNVFGTLNLVEVSEKYGVKKFTLISTDKAVNPTNVMGATKRMCEMIVQGRNGKTNFSATRFGNVLGSNGSVIPLFKRQIEGGGPVTLTDRRIIRYFMTIKEASQLVLASGAMAKNGELYVLDMGEPVRILELAENMIRLSGFEPYKDIDIVETGLRPGEKLYEELLIKTEELGKTENSMLFIERDKGLARDELNAKLDVLREAVATDDNEAVREALKEVVSTYHAPEEVNGAAEVGDVGKGDAEMSEESGNVNVMKVGKSGADVGEEISGDVEVENAKGRDGEEKRKKINYA